MKTWLRKLRGILGIGAVWGVTCSALGFALGVYVSIFWPEEIPTSVVKFMTFVALRFGVLGFVFGSGFAGILTIMHGRKTFEELSSGRAALWGALSGVGAVTATGLINLGLWLGSGFPLVELIPAFVVTTCIYGAVTAGLGAGTVSLARQAPAELEPGTVLHERKLLIGSAKS